MADGGGAVSGWRSFNVDDSDEEFERGEDKWSGKTALLIAIDATPPMFEGWEENDETPFLAAIKCCESIWRNKIVSNPGDLVSIVLVGTENSRNSNFSNIYELQEFSTVKVSMIKELLEMKASQDLCGFPDKIGTSESYNLKELFWQAKMSFDKAKSQTFRKKLIYFTCEDNPHKGNSNLQADVVSKFKDLGNIEFNIVSFKEDFNFTLFYSKLLEDESAVILARNLEKLTKIIRMKQRLKRPISRSTLEVAPGMKIGIGYHSFIRKAIPPRTVPINKRNNEILERSVNVFRADTGMPVLKSEARKIVSIQGETASFTPQEIKEIKVVQERGVKILAYLNMRDVDFYSWYRSPCYFLYPEEESITGSKELFTTLLERCHALEKMPLVKYVLTRGKSPKLGILIPSVPDEEEKSIFPQGFHIFPIPFSDEVRKHEVESFVEATPELIALMEKVVKKLTNTKFDVLEVKNPFLQTLWAKLEVEAIEQRADDGQAMLDYTEPNEEMMAARLKSIPAEIDRKVEIFTREFNENMLNAPIQKPKIDVEMEARHGRLMHCTCAQLREFLTDRGLDVPKISGKNYLIGLVNKCLGSGYRD